ncbi:enoyl-CoA hydratase-related protein [Rhodovulum sulfidophilum]|uniref:enoyl-CoA hydratase/isomerase family protein n=1 Tax=Rhodovulum sulfidophilum TaxID=35806 RepID=UPI001922F0EF|nr:enoyl-CoA hydratase/isomerase family protein [Rhodovulum sulfidophilum]MBL3575243.1 enoyl-CoA hydratase/isomerase family protein [Rhodovulum sulfidophilum]MCE8431038.1 enoyl-CoA hydratase-related protein [Rhodovulum sulfidophilum]MCF4117641.1 enoyl-CoA hydratase-related protein [Rhodovulum sulfidophilum]
MAPLLAVEHPAPGVVRLVLDAPPDNALTAPLHDVLDAGLTAALAAGSTRAVMIAARGTVFSAGASPAPSGTAAPLGAICGRIDAAEVPVVALLPGPATGPGCELALACHYRVATRTAALCLPDIALGLPPQAGTTSRLPRLTDPVTALELMLSARPFSASRARQTGLLDALVDGDLDTAGLRFVLGLLVEGAGPRPAPSRLMPEFRALQALLQRLRAGTGPKGAVRARRAVLDCVEAAAMMPAEAALAFEEAAVEDCRDSAVHRALCHLAEAEHALTARARDWAEAGPEPRRVGIWGWGPQAAALGAALLTAGPSVRLGAPDAATLGRGLVEIEALLDAARLTAGWDEATRVRYRARLSAGPGPSALTGCDAVIEAGSGTMSDRQVRFPDLARVAAPGAVLAATGGLASPSALGAPAGREADTVWFHLPEAVPGCRLAEVIRSPRTGPRPVAVFGALARRLERLVLVAERESPSQVLLLGALDAADGMVEAGAAPAAVDAAMEAWGMALGPYRMADRLGLSQLLALRRRQPGGDDPELRPVLILGQLVREGREGYLAGRGYYRYGAGGAAGPDPQVAEIVAAAREVLAVGTLRDFAEAEIQARVLAGMVQAGAALLRRGGVSSAAELDLAAVHGLGVARWRGGPMRAADEAGLLSVRKTLRALADERPRGGIWDLDPLLAETIKNGRELASAVAPGRGALSPA